MVGAGSEVRAADDGAGVDGGTDGGTGGGGTGGGTGGGDGGGGAGLQISEKGRTNPSAWWYW